VSLTAGVFTEDGSFIGQYAPKKKGKGDSSGGAPSAAVSPLPSYPPPPAPSAPVAVEFHNHQFGSIV
jgi:hypothetical protein